MIPKLHASVRDFSNELVAFNGHVLGYVKDPYTVVVKTYRCAKGVYKCVEELIAASATCSVVFSYLDSLKVCHIPFYSAKSFNAMHALLHAKDMRTRVYKTSKLYDSLKKFTTGVQTVVFCIKDRISIAPQVFRTLDILHYVFLPNTTVEAIVGGYKGIKIAVFYAASSPYLQAVDTSEKVKKAVSYLEEQEKELVRLKVCTKKNMFFEKIQNVKQIQDESEKIKAAGALIGQLKHRMQHQITHKAVRTCFKVLSIAISILGYVQIAAPALAVLELTGATGRLATVLYGKCSE